MKYHISGILAIIIIALTLNGCSGCSRSGQNHLRESRTSSRHRVSRNKRVARSEEPSKQTEPIQTEQKPYPVVKSHSTSTSNHTKTTIHMKEHNGTYTVPMSINGFQMDFIFDTGASIISISKTEANFLIKNGHLTKSDFINKGKFTDANGDVSVGDIINIREIKIGDMTLENIQASIVDNNIAPLLLGQSVLAKFAKISIDYEKGTITLE